MDHEGSGQPSITAVYVLQIITTFDYGRNMDRLIEQAALLALLRDRKAGWSLVADEVEERESALEVLRRGDLQMPIQGELFGPDTSTDAEQMLDESAPSCGNGWQPASPSDTA